MAKKNLLWFSVSFGVSLIGSALLLGVVLAQSTGDSATGSSTGNSATTDSCTSAGGQWCKSSSGGSDWCSYSTSPCPPYDTASCAAQGGEWCAYTGGGGGWCATGGSECPINDQASCSAKGRNWCAGTSGGMGWCASSGSTCPATDEPSCAAQGGEWCSSSYGGSGWCNSTPGSCPINDKASCEAKSRSWCASSSGSSGSGYCATTGSSCPTYTCTDGTVVSNSASCPSSSSSSNNNTYNTYSYTWPSNETDCVKYKGVWCNSTYSGSASMSAGYCNMAGYKCPVAAPAGKTTCWDNTFATSWSECPATPTTENDCKNKGYSWCNSTYSSTASYTSGWCTANGVCSKMPPSGQMTCPDNETFATKLTDCPAAQTTVQPTTKTCDDGSVVASTATCPVYKTCQDGTKVLSGAECPVKTEDPATACLNKGGKWCLDSSGGNGYCASSGGCTITVTTIDKVVEIVPVPKPLTTAQLKLVEQKKKEYGRKLDGLETVFKKYEDAASLERTKALKEKLSSLSSDSSVFDTLEVIKDDILTLVEVKEELLTDKEGEVLTDRDREMQAKALAKLKKDITAFTRRLTLIEVKAKRVQKLGFVVKSSLSELLVKGRELTAAIKNAKNFEEAKDAAEELSEVAEELNSWVPRLEQLAQLGRFHKMIGLEISQREKAFARKQAQVKRLKVDFEAPLAEVKAALAAAREAYNSLKTRDYGDEEPFDYIQVNIVEKLEDADNTLYNISSLATLKASINQLNVRLSRYEARINRLAKQKKNVTELKELFASLKESREELRGYAGMALAEIDVSAVLDLWKKIDETASKIEDLLKISVPSALEKELRKGLEVESLKIDVPELEKQVIRAYRVSTFFRRSPGNLAEYYSYGNKGSVDKWRNRLAIEQ